MGLNIEKSDKTLELFYENPAKAFTIREVSKLTGLPKSTLHPYLNYFKKKGLIKNNNQSSENSLLFKIKKINYHIEKIVTTGLLEYLIKELNPSCVILFGSCRKGESEQESDIDIFVESHIKKDINLEKFEKLLKHKVQLFIETNINKLPSHLLNNIVNGIKLHGSFKVK